MTPPPTRRSFWTWGGLLVLPLVFMAAAFWVRASSGPFWLWFNLDPDHVYLMSSLTLGEGRAPGHVDHPGTTVQALGAAVLKAATPGANSAERTFRVIGDSEHYLSIMAAVHVTLIGLAMLAAGMIAFAASGRVIEAMLLQCGPLLVGLVLKHAPHVKPEPLLVVAVLLMMGAAAACLREDWLERHRDRLAGWFGVLAGFTLATKITAAPVLILPLFILGRWRARIIYAVMSAVALALFLVPIWPVLGRMMDWIGTIAMGSGAYGAGAGQVVDLAAYPGNLRKLLARPLFHGPLLAALGLVLWSFWRALPKSEIRLLGGIAATQLLHVALVAKHPSAHYMIPSYVLGGLTLMVVYRLASRGHLGAWVDRPWARFGTIAVVAGIVLSQAASIHRLTKEARGQRNAALSVDERRFAGCAHVATDFASRRSYALYFGSHLDGLTHLPELKAGQPADHFWYVAFKNQFRTWDGIADPATTLAPYSCVVLRGSAEQGMFGIAEAALRKALPDRTWNRSCSTRDEIILASGIDCR